MQKTSPWAWIPTLYFAEGLPYMMIMVVSGIMYKNLNVSNTELALYTSMLYLPWVIKPLWSPLVELVRTNRFWIVSMQLLLGLCMAGVAFTIPLENPLRYTMVFFWVAAFSSATHDIAADGYYMIALREDQQSFFVGIRSLFYRVAMWFSQGALVIVAGLLGNRFGIETGWSIAFGIAGALMVLLAVFHAYIFPKKLDKPIEPCEEEIDEIGGQPTKKKPQQELKKSFDDFGKIFYTFLAKKEILIILAYVLLYRFSEAQLVKIAQPFMLDDRAVGGLGLSTEAVGLIYGTVGLIGLIVGGILGGILISRDGLKAWLWPMVIAINLPNAAYLFLALTQPESSYIMMAAVAIEQFGYGFGFSAFLMYLIYVSQGPYKTAHYAFATGLMAAGMMLPGMLSGWVQEQLGYPGFFTWILIATVPAILLTAFVKVDPDFGKK
ncbi:MAG: MFS transporter [Bacteroidia bacterium]